MMNAMKGAKNRYCDNELRGESATLNLVRREDLTGEVTLHMKETLAETWGQG